VADTVPLKLPSDNADPSNVVQRVRHIGSIQLRRVERLAALPVSAIDTIPAGPLEALFDVLCR
jgi:hypothetical protein